MSNPTNDRILQIAWNTGSNFVGVRDNINTARELIEADDALPEAERQITPDARMELAVALKSQGGSLWSQIGQDLNALNERLPEPPTDTD